MNSKKMNRKRTAIATAGAVVLGLVATACGSDSQAAGATPAATAASVAPVVTTTPTTGVVATGDAAIAEKALLVGSDIGSQWGISDHKSDFPNSAELARTIPECADFAELVFNGGKEHGVGVSRTLYTLSDLVFTYAVVFPTEEEAAAMVSAASTPEFDDCWAAFNDAAVVQQPYGISKASYHPSPPPALTFTADSSTVKFLEGSVTIGGNDLVDTCVCVFAQVGRGVVEVHSVKPNFDDAKRSAIVQTAIDRLRSALA